MFNIKKALGLSDEGYRSFKRAVASVVLTNLSLFLPFVVIMQAVIALLNPLLTNSPLDTRRMTLLLALGVFAAFLHFFSYRNEYRKTYTSAYRESEKIRIEVAEHIRKLPLSFFNNRDLAELTTNIMADCTSIEHVMSHVTPGLLGDIITSTGICALLAFYDWRMSAAVFAALPVSFGLIFLSRRLLKKPMERHVQVKRDVSGQVQEYLDGIKVVKAFGLGGEKSAALKGALRSMMKSAIKSELAGGIFVTLASTFLQVGIGFVVMTGVFLLTGGALDVVKLLAFFLISAKIYTPLILIMTLLLEFFFSLLSGQRIQNLRREPLMTGDENFVPDNYNIELCNVGFSYHNGEDVIKGLNLSIPQNAVTALVGPSGSGKSTLLRLIARFWDTGEGEIRIGGKNIREIDPETIMEYMSFVFQDVVLFNDTIANNIRVGKHGARGDEITAAAKLARCDQFITALPGGYNTLIGENGSTLSGGERQRISIARALLKNAPIVLLDEATASLDPENETLIQEALSTLVQGRTVIVVAHRLRTVMGADKIAVLDKGRLVEEGGGRELLARNGLFARLYGIQRESLGWSVGKRIKSGG